LPLSVAGHSRLIGPAEAGTLARLRTIRAELIDPRSLPTMAEPLTPIGTRL
jgi:hypothetical protein